MSKKVIFIGLLTSFFLIFPHIIHAQPNKKNHIGVGLGISNAISTVELNLSMKPMPFELNYRYYLTKGLGISLELYAIQKKRIRWHVLSPGLYFLMGTDPLTVRGTRHDRRMDITFGTGIDILPWKNLVISVSLRWFLPGLSSAYAAGEEAALEYSLEHFKFDFDKSLEDIIKENGKAAFEIASQETRNIYKQAAKEPHFQITFTWYFL